MSRPVKSTVAERAAPGTALVPSHLAMPAPLQAYVQQKLDGISAIGGDLDSLWMAVKAGAQMEMAGRIIAGRACQAISEQVERLAGGRPGNLSERSDKVPAPGKSPLAQEIESRGMRRDQFYEFLNLYQAFSRLSSADQVEALASLGPSKCQEIARWQPDECLALVSGEPVRGISLDNAVDMTVRDFKAATKSPEAVALRQRTRELEVANQTLRLERQALENKLASRAMRKSEPLWYLAVRQEAAACATSIDASLTLLEEVLRDNLPAPMRGDAGSVHLGVNAAGTVYHLLRAQVLRGQTLLAQIEEGWGAAATGRAQGEFMLLGDELAQATSNASLIFNGLEAEATARAQIRAAQAPRGPGKPPRPPEVRIKGRKG